MLISYVPHQRQTSTVVTSTSLLIMLQNVVLRQVERV
jgi:hypothetical protein